MTILLLRLLLGFCYDWEDISSTRDSVSSAIQTPRISSKILRCASYFQLPSRCLDIPMKHCRSCLIYYFTCWILLHLYHYYILRYYIMCLKKVITFCVEKLLHFAAIIITYCITITFCGVTTTLKDRDTEKLVRRDARSK